MVSLSYGFDATVHYLSEEHLQFAITAILILLFILLPPFSADFLPHFMDVTVMELLKGRIFDQCLESICSFRL